MLNRVLNQRVRDQLRSLNKQYWHGRKILDINGRISAVEQGDGCIGKWAIPFGGDTPAEIAQEIHKPVDSDCPERSMSVWIVYAPDYALYSFPDDAMLLQEMQRSANRSLFIFGL